MAGPAAAHRDGKAEPRIAARATGKGLDRTLIVRLTDLDSDKPISGATVEVETSMTRPHFMSLIPRKVPEYSPPGTYRLPYHFIMTGDWTAEFRVSGSKVIAAEANLPVPITESAQRASAQDLQPLPTRLETDVTGRDWLTMLVLWLHSTAALTWIVGVIAMGIAFATPPLLAGSVRTRVAAAYRSWGAWVHWAAVPVIVGTGIYNMVYVTPFELRWPWDAKLDAVAYGNVYEAILFIKLALFVVLLATGTAMLLRVVRPQAAGVPAVAHGSAEPTSGLVRTLVTALGPAGIAYVLTVPLILAAAMA